MLSETYLCDWGHCKFQGHAGAHIILETVMLVLSECFVLESRRTAVFGDETIHLERMRVEGGGRSRESNETQ